MSGQHHRRLPGPRLKGQRAAAGKGRDEPGENRRQSVKRVVPQDLLDRELHDSGRCGSPALLARGQNRGRPGSRCPLASHCPPAPVASLSAASS